MSTIELKWNTNTIKLAASQFGISTDPAGGFYNNSGMRKAFAVETMQFQRFNEEDYPGQNAQIAPFTTKDVGSDEKIQAEFALNEKGQIELVDILFGLGNDADLLKLQNNNKSISIQAKDLQNKGIFSDRIYDEETGDRVNIKEEGQIEKTIDLTVLPTKMYIVDLTQETGQREHREELMPPKLLKEGRQYRIEIGILDQQGNIIYRHMEKVIIQKNKIQ